MSMELPPDRGSKTRQAIDYEWIAWNGYL